MSRAIKDIDKELHDCVLSRKHVLDEMTTPGQPMGDREGSRKARLDVINARIERLLEERSVVRFEQQIASL